MDNKEFFGYIDKFGQYCEYYYKCLDDSPFHYNKTKGMIVRRVNGEGMKMLKKDGDNEYSMCLLVEWAPTGERFWISQNSLEIENANWEN